MKKQMYLVMLACLSLIAQAQTVIPSYVPTNSLVGWWPFNGNANDLSVNANNGTVNGATLTADRFGNANKAYNFNGNNISTNYGGILGNGSRSISFWYNLNQNSSPSDMNVMVAYGENGQCGGGWSCSVLGNKPVIDISTSYAVYNNLGALNNWYFYCITYDPSFGSGVLNTKVYINGVFQTITSSTNATICAINTGTINKLKFGGYSNPLQYFNGKIDDIGIWSRALSDCEIKKLYYAPSFSASASNPTICAGQSLTLTAGGVPNYAWSNGANTASAVVTPSATTIYTVTSTYTTGCTDTKTVSVTVNACTGISEAQLSNELSVYPNPTKDNITVVSSSNFIGKTYSITDQLGKLISNGKLTSENMKISLSSFPNGLYFVKIEGQTFKIIKE